MYPAGSIFDLSQYDFTSKENEIKWKGLFVPGLQKVSEQVGHSTKTKEDAFYHVERLILQLLGLLCGKPTPYTVSEIQDRIQKMFPAPVDKWAIDEATSALNRQGKKKNVELVFPVDKIHSLLQKDVLQHKIDHNVTVYISAVLEYIAADILHLVGNYVKHSRHGELTVQDIKAALICDKVLCDLFKLGDTNSLDITEEPTTRNSLSYDELVDDFLHSERQYLRDLQMLTRVFREQLASQLDMVNRRLEIVFVCIEDITELTITLISFLEDTLEMNEPNQVPPIGACFLELAENGEFDVYDRYVEAFSEDCQRELTEILSQHDIESTLSTAGHGYVEAVKFYFPKLLLEPLYHCIQYFDYIKLLHGLSPSEADKAEFLQADSVLTTLKSLMDSLSLSIPKKMTGDVNSRISGRGNKQIAQRKGVDIRNQVEGFNELYANSYFNEFFLGNSVSDTFSSYRNASKEGELLKVGGGKKPSERYACLFDGCVILAKPNYRRTSVVGGSQHEYRLKEFYYLTKLEVRDKEDSDEWKNIFEILPRDQSALVLSTRTYEEKANWMAALVMLTTKTMLDRLLDRILSDDERKHPLRLPTKEKYRFAVPDLEDNIVLDKDNGNHAVIKGATLLKLVERLTHHQYSDPNFVNTFLTTYRSFCSQHEFLDLLIERFDIPDPEYSDLEIESIRAREMLKKFRKEYSRLVRLRVMNVIKQWVTHHFYDFERDPTLQQRLEDFLENNDDCRGKNSISESVRRCLRKAVENSQFELDRAFSDVKSPPPIEYHIKCPMSEWSILTLHPIEFARQLTLIEFDYYRVVKPSELVGSVWTKKNKEKSSPNLLRMIKHTTNVTRWFEKSIVDTDNLEERVATVSRILEVMVVLQELNNFNGVLAVVSAMGSASVYRLNFTFQAVSLRLMKALEEAQELQNDHYKKYQDRLRSINPPCVPFFGMYLSNILHIEEGNRDFLPQSDQLINFSKRRKVAEITSEIRQFQYSHYVLATENRIREFIEKLQPFDVETPENEISNYLYERSLIIEPRGGKQPIKFPRKWADLNLKSPGIKPKHMPGRSHPGPLLPFSSSTSTLNFSSSRMRLIDEMETQSLNEASSQTPKTLTPSSIPSTSSPSNSGFPNDFSIFAPVLIGQIPNTPPGGTGSPSGPSTHVVHYNTSLPQNHNIPTTTTMPPPLPPRSRREREGSITDSLSPQLIEATDLPPPLPPRKVSPRLPNPPIPRRNSAALPSDLPSVSPGSSLNSPRRLTPNQNGPITQFSPCLIGCQGGLSELNRTAFDFPLRTVNSPLIPPQVPPPKLPPKSLRTLANNQS